MRATGAAEVEGEHPPPDLRGDAVGQLGEREPRRERAARRRREVVTQHEAGRRPARRRPRPVRREHGAVGMFDRQVHRGSSSRVTIILAIVTDHHARRPGVQGMGGRRPGPARGRADPRRPQGRPPRGRAGTSRSRPTRVWLYPTVEHQEPDLREAGVPPLGRPHRGRGATRPRPSGSRAGPTSSASPRSPSPRCSTRSTARSCGHAPTSRRGTAGRHATRSHVLALRVHRLAEPVAVPFREEYGGCTSWVDLDGPARPGPRSRRRRRCPTSRSTARLKGAAEAVGGFAPPRSPERQARTRRRLDGPARRGAECRVERRSSAVRLRTTRVVVDPGVRARVDRGCCSTPGRESGCDPGCGGGRTGRPVGSTRVAELVEERRVLPPAVVEELGPAPRAVRRTVARPSWLRSTQTPRVRDHAGRRTRARPRP